MAGEEIPLGEKGWLYHPEYPAHWERCSLYSMAEWVNGLTFRDAQFSPSGMPVIKIAEIKGGVSGQTKFTQQTFDESVRVRQGDLLFSWSGQPETSIDAFWWRGPQGWLNQHVFRVTPTKGVDLTFLYYLLRYLNSNFVGIARNKQTTGLGHVTKRDLENLEGAFPKLTEQLAIAHVLRSLDDKIELNRRMNETLEIMARALFKSWFVDFDPVQAKAEGRDSGLPKEIGDLFPSRLVESELGKIPQGWEVVPLYDVATYINGAAYSSFEPNDERRGLPVVKIAELKSGVTRQTKYSDVHMPERYRIRRGDILFSWSGNPDTSIDTFIWSHGDAWLNQHIFRVMPHEPQHRSFVIALLKHLRPVFSETARNKQTTGLGHVTSADMKRLLVAFPCDRIMRAWSAIGDPLLDRAFLCNVESQGIAALRDELLPQLFSGQIRVKDAERFIARSA